MSVEKKQEVASVSSELTQEIEGAVTTIVEQAAAERKQQEQQSATTVVALPDGQQTVTDDTTSNDDDKGKGNAKDGDQGAKKPVTDDLIERAVKAGLSLKDAQTMTDSDVLTRVVERLEVKSKLTDEKLPVGGGENTEDASSVLDEEIPDLDPNEYDEEIVKGFKAMKGLIKKQNEVIAQLRSGTTEGDAVTQQLQKLGKKYVDAAPAGSDERAKLEKKLKVLKAGYKAAGEEIADDDLFTEAVKMVLGDVSEEEDPNRKADQVAARKRLLIARPSGTSTKPKGDVYEDVAKEIDAIYGK